MPKQKESKISISLSKYTNDQISRIDVWKIEKAVELLIDLQVGIINRINSSTRALLTKNDVNGLTFPFFRVMWSFNDLWLFFRLKSCGDGMGIIFKFLKDMYMQKWADANTAMKEANKTMNDFYTAAAEVSKEVKNENGDVIKKWYAPFVVNMFPYNKDEAHIAPELDL